MEDSINQVAFWRRWSPAVGCTSKARRLRLTNTYGSTGHDHWFVRKNKKWTQIWTGPWKITQFVSSLVVSDTHLLVAALRQVVGCWPPMADTVVRRRWSPAVGCLAATAVYNPSTPPDAHAGLGTASHGADHRRRRLASRNFSDLLVLLATPNSVGKTRFAWYCSRNWISRKKWIGTRIFRYF